MRSTRLPSWIERLLGLDQVPAPPHVFALDYGELAYGCFHRGPQGLVFESYRQAALPAGCFADGVLGGPIREPRIFWEALQGLVGGVSEPIKEASLVLPDSWLRLTFTESEELPRSAKARDEILRFKLKRLVPFRVEDLRIAATPVEPLSGQEAPQRLLLGFAIEQLLAQLEEAFSGVGITLGQVTNTTLAVLAGLARNVRAGELAALVVVRPEAFTLSYFDAEEPLIYRYKSFGDAPPWVVEPTAVRRDLRLTTSFIAQQLPERPLGRLFLVAPEEDEGRWRDWLVEELGIECEPIGFEHFPLARTQVGASWLTTAPLLGAACLEVS